MVINRLYYSKNTVDNNQALPWLIFLIILISKEYFVYDPETILFIILFITIFYKTFINEQIEKEYYKIEFFWYELYLFKSCVARDYWKLGFTISDNADKNIVSSTKYNQYLNKFFKHNKKKYFLFLYFIVKTRFLKNLINRISFHYDVLLTNLNNFIYNK